MPIHILMVCLGNICRSPLAEGILQSKLPKDRFIIDSAGTSSFHLGDHPDKRSITIAQNHNIDIAQQQSRPFKTVDFDQFDYIYVMDKSNYADVVALAKTSEHTSKVQLLIANGEVPDPYYGDLSDFEKVFHLIDYHCTQIAQKLIQTH